MCKKVEKFDAPLIFWCPLADKGASLPGHYL